MFIAKKEKIHVLIDLAHYDEVVWSGGKYRSTQTFEIFESNGFEIAKVEEPVRPGKLSLVLWALRSIFKFGIYKPFHLTGLRVCGYGFYKYSFLSKHYPDVNTYLIEGTGFGVLQSVMVLKQLGKKVILAPINVESLVPYPDAWTHSLPVLKRLKEEVKYYNHADAVFCISLEESWILSILGAKTYFLPYYPPSKLLNKINQRRELRSGINERRGSFYYANFNNYPNYLGFKQFINDELFKGKNIKVAGLNVEKVRPIIGNRAEFTILGELTEEQLEAELVSCESVILNHFPTGGMLTRIPELLLSGIPVDGNLAALKAYLMMPNCVDRSEHLTRLAKEGASQLLKEIMD